MSIILEKNRNNGSIIASTIVNNQYIKQVYYGYSIKDIKRLFKEYVKHYFDDCIYNV